MYKKGAGNDKQEKDAGNRTLCPYRNFSQAIMEEYSIYSTPEGGIARKAGIVVAYLDGLLDFYSKME